MPQTLLAIGAMMVATFFAYQQQRSVMQTRMSMIRNEIESAATSVAVDHLGEISVMAFDEATKGDGKIFSPSSLTPKPQFRDDAPPVDDVDDYDGTYVQRYRVFAADTLWFGIATEVHYASETYPDQIITDPTVRTKFKKATVSVFSLSAAKPDTIRLSQSFACGSKCAW